MRIGFLGDSESVNSQSWIGAMRAVDGVEVIGWSLSHHRERQKLENRPRQAMNTPKRKTEDNHLTFLHMA